MDFFIDGLHVATINSGDYAIRDVTAGPHTLKHCINGAGQNEPENCFTRTTTFSEQPELWQMFDETNPLTASAEVELLLLNQSALEQDVYIDGQFAAAIAPHDYASIRLARGEHSVEPCARGSTPPGGRCAGPYPLNVEQETESFRITRGPS
jgi:hypothetical protein